MILRTTVSPMAMGKRQRRPRQTSMWVATQDLPRSAAHPFYRAPPRVRAASLFAREAGSSLRAAEGAARRQSRLVSASPSGSDARRCTGSLERSARRRIGAPPRGMIMHTASLGPPPGVLDSVRTESEGGSLRDEATLAPRVVASMSRRGRTAIRPRSLIARSHCSSRTSRRGRSRPARSRARGVTAQRDRDMSPAAVKREVNGSRRNFDMMSSHEPHTG